MRHKLQAPCASAMTPTLARKFAGRSRPMTARPAPASAEAEKPTG